MKLKKLYECEANIPSDGEISECIKIAKDENCTVELQWYVEWSGWYSIKIDGSRTFEEYKKEITSMVYPI